MLLPDLGVNMLKRVVIVDSQPIVLEGLKGVLNAEPDLEVVGEASCCENGCLSVSELAPDLVILDLEFTDACGAEVIRHFRTRFPRLPAIVYTNQRDRELIAEALKYNIQGYVLKTSPTDHLFQAIRFVGAHRSYLDPAVTSAVLAEFSYDRVPQGDPVLSPREFTVLRMLAEGKRNKEIAKDLFISERTVKFHVSAVLRRLQAQNRTHAVRVAEERGLISKPGQSRNPPPSHSEPQDTGTFASTPEFERRRRARTAVVRSEHHGSMSARETTARQAGAGDSQGGKILDVVPLLTAKARGGK